MMNLTQRDNKDNCNGSYANRSPFSFEFCRHALTKRNGTGFELFKSRSDEQVSRPGIRFRGLASFDISGHTQIQSSKVTRMESSRVVSPRSWRRPSMDSFPVISLYGETKASVNGLHIAPRNRMSRNWIDDFNSLVKDNDFRFMHKYIKSTNGERGPRATDGNIFGSAGNYGFKDQRKKNKTQEVKSSAAGATSEKFNIGTGLFFTFHKRRFSQVGRVCLV